VTPGFQGTSAATSQSILHDPANFNDFIIGGFGFVGRATITGPGAVSYALITNGISEACQLSWDNAGNIVVADAGTDRVRQLTTGGVITDLSVGAQAWGTSLNAGAYEPATGDVIVGNSGGLYRLPNGVPTSVPIVTGLGGFVSVVAFDPATGDILATVLSISRIVRVTSGGTVTDIVNTAYGAIPLPLLLDPILGTSSCFLNVSPDYSPVAFADAAGAMAVSFTPTPPFAGQTIYIQHSVLEGVPGGLSFSNGVSIHF
jgi:hypothetical protein